MLTSRICTWRTAIITRTSYKSKCKFCAIAMVTHNLMINNRSRILSKSLISFIRASWMIISQKSAKNRFARYFLIILWTRRIMSSKNWDIRFWIKMGTIKIIVFKYWETWTLKYSLSSNLRKNKIKILYSRVIDKKSS